MVECSIPWRQADNPAFREFLAKCVGGHYGEVQVPTESTLRKLYSPQAAETVVQNIRSELDGKYIWVTVDETTNAVGAKIAHVLVGALDELHSNRGHLVASKELEHATADSVSTLVCDSLKLVWGPGYEENKNKFLLFLTDAAAYMKAAGRMLQTTFNCLHVTCLAHALHRVAEAVRECYPKVDTLIANVKKVFRKAPNRTRVFMEILPNIQLPPNPIVTRWGTWLEAATYYYIHLDDVKQVLEQLDPKHAVAIASAQEIVKDPTLPNSLQQIHSYFSRIPLAIRQLEQRPADTFAFCDAVNVVHDLRQHIAQLTGDAANRVKDKLHNVLVSNPGFSTLESIYNLFQKQEVDFAAPGLHTSSLYNYSLFRYPPITSVDVERSFSIYKWLFSSRRRSFTPANFENLLIIYMYSHPDQYNAEESAD